MVVFTVLFTVMGITYQAFNKVSSINQIAQDAIPNGVILSVNPLPNDIKESEYKSMLADHRPMSGDVVNEIYNSNIDKVEAYDYQISFSNFRYLGGVKSVRQFETLNQDVINDEPVSLVTTTLTDASYLKNKNIDLVDGRYFNETEINNGDKKVIILKEFATLNHLSIGDTLKLNQVEVSQGNDMTLVETNIREIELEVIGVLDKEKPQSNGEELMQTSEQRNIEGFKEATYYQFVNTIYLPTYLVERISEESGLFQVTNGFLSEYSVTFYLKNTNDIDAFIKDAEAIYKSPMMSYKTTYKTLQDSFSTLSDSIGLFRLALVIELVVMAIVFLLINAIMFRNRLDEIGVYLSLGEKEIKIMLQYIIESIGYVVVSFVIALAMVVMLVSQVGTTSMLPLLKSTLAPTELERTLNNEAVFSVLNSTQLNKVQVSLSSIATSFLIIILLVIISYIIISVVMIKLDTRIIEKNG